MISVVIPNWNGRKFLAPCLDAVFRQTHKDFEVILADNGSEDGSVDFVREHYSRVRVVALPTNRGFPVACNEGIRNSRGEFIALLNNDTEAHPRWLEEMEKVLSSRNDAGLCACKILLLSRPEIIDSIGIYFCSNGIGGNRRFLERDTGSFDLVEDIFGACGCAVLFRKSMLEEIGLFDEDFFAYYEDTDLCLRAQLAGYKCVSAPKSIVYHHGSGTNLDILMERGRPRLTSSNGPSRLTYGASGHLSDFIVYYMTRNRLNIILKDLPAALLFRYSLELLFTELWLFLSSIKIRKARAFLKGRLDSLRDVPRTLKKRWEIQKKRKVPARYLRTVLTEVGLGHYWRRIVAKIKGCDSI